ncbi:MAG: hypothetical protein K9K33_18265 [Desulfarculaceae bacterium]|nr:hypothetical protein [Desulfarculaceae bacterium]
MGVIVAGGADLEREAYWDSDLRPLERPVFGFIDLQIMNLTPTALTLGPAKFERELILEFRLAFAELRDRYEENPGERAA